MHVTADGTGLQLVFIIPIYLFSEIFPGVSRGPSVFLAAGPIHQFGRHWGIFISSVILTE